MHPDVPIGAPRRRRRIVPEAIQISAMDCGPVALHTLLAGHGLPSDYARLRESCQTDLDGSSIDVLEEVAQSRGLDAEQVVIPHDHLVLESPASLPAIVVTRRPGGQTHFVVVWSHRWGFLQIMDPAVGRRWVRVSTFLHECYQHRQKVAANAWAEWARDDEFRRAIERRAVDLGLEESAATDLWVAASEAPGWQDLAALDACIRCAATLRAAGVLKGRDAVAEGLEKLLLRAREDPTAIPDRFWSVTSPTTPAVAANAEEEVWVRGIVLLRVGKVLDHSSRSDERNVTRKAEVLAKDAPGPSLLSSAASATTPPLHRIFETLRPSGWLDPLMILLLLVLSSATTLLEALLFRGLIEASPWIGNRPQRIAGLVALLSLLMLGLAIHGTILRRSMDLGGELEGRLRVSLLDKLARLSDRYFSSRLVSDLAERAHVLHRLRDFPPFLADLVGRSTRLVLTAMALSVLVPSMALPVIALALSLLLVPQLIRPLHQERDLSWRTHASALGRYQLDALRGLVPLRTHASEDLLAYQHESQLSAWRRTGFSLHRLVVGADALQFTLGYGGAAIILWTFLTRSPQDPRALLFAYWTLQLPRHGEGVAQALRRYPILRSTIQRAAEPLGAPEEFSAPSSASSQEPFPLITPATEMTRSTSGVRTHGVEVRFTSVTVRSGGRALLEEIDLYLPSGQHVAIVGSSGAGKSTLLGTLLGWHPIADGRLQIDGHLFAGARISELRRDTAWIAPEVRLWNRSLLENITHGSSQPESSLRQEQLRDSEVLPLLENLPEGSATFLGEGGGRVSGGEGQRLRIARGLGRPHVRLALLDEAFRGLDRTQSRRLLGRLRKTWSTATLLWVTHDIEATLEMPRVVVLERGRIVEDGTPQQLERIPGSRYATLLAADRQRFESGGSGQTWRRVYLADGALREEAP
ncbi:MAG: ATP-binding cassette domain-containing protein [Thermoanaerobaculia bacterium]|nr:ATP-binding cassette domain-containing protein [Thermoanaerobaculia bacterium]